MKSKALLIFAFVCVFVLGVTTGVSVSMRWGREEIEKRAWQMHAKRNFQKLADDLQLTPAQRERIRPLISEAFRAQRKNFVEIRREFRRMEEAMLKEMTEPQQARFREIRDQLEQRWQRGAREGKRPGEPRPPGAESEGEKRESTDKE